MELTKSMKNILVLFALSLALTACPKTEDSPKKSAWIGASEKLVSLPPASFSDEYRAQHKGMVSVVTEPIHELFYIVMALTTAGREKKSSLLYQGSTYYAEVIKTFQEYMDHPAVLRLDELLKGDVYAHMEVKLDAMAYDLTKTGEIEKGVIYARIRGDTDAFALWREDFQDFATKSRFAEFYRRPDIQGIYREEQNWAKKDANVQDMMLWLQNQYSDVEPFDSIKVVVSPMTNGFNHQNAVADGNFRELIVHIASPSSSTDDPDLSEEGQRFWEGVSTSLFTELNHGFVDEKAESYAQDIVNAFKGKVDVFVDYSRGGQRYGNAKLIFAEYMNWALIGPYARHKLSENEVEKIVKKTSTVMFKRGFSRFPEFHDFLLRLTLEESERTISALHPEIIAWFEDQEA